MKGLNTTGIFFLKVWWIMGLDIRKMSQLFVSVLGVVKYYPQQKNYSATIALATMIFRRREGSKTAPTPPPENNKKVGRRIINNWRGFIFLIKSIILALRNFMVVVSIRNLDIGGGFLPAPYLKVCFLFS